MGTREALDFMRDHYAEAKRIAPTVYADEWELWDRFYAAVEALLAYVRDREE